MLYRADWLLTGEGPAARDGWIRVENDRIAAVGSGESPPLGPDEETRSFDGCALMPGLINAHCHLELTALENNLEPGKAFPEWVRDLQGVTSDMKLPDYRESSRRGIARLLRGGAATVLDVGNTGEAVKALAESPLRAFACVEALGLDPDQAASRFENARSLARAVEPSSRFKPGLAPHAPYSCSVELLRSVIQYQKSNGLPVTLHAAESREEAELFASASGPLQEFCKRIYPASPEHHNTTPVRWLESGGLLPDGALIVHGNHLDATDMEILLRRKATVVHCPSSHAFFGHRPFPYAALRARGIPVCLGTDSLASGDSLSMLDQMRMFAEAHPEASAADVLKMATAEAADALGIGAETGRLRPGLRADFAVAETEALHEGSPPTNMFKSGQVKYLVLSGVPVDFTLLLA